jgi:hypothetical protein
MTFLVAGSVARPPRSHEQTSSREAHPADVKKDEGRSGSDLMVAGLEGTGATATVLLRPLAVSQARGFAGSGITPPTPTPALPPRTQLPVIAW